MVYVSANQTTNTPPDGCSWLTAFPSVQQGLAAAGAGDEVWVAAATYGETVTLQEGVALLGGFAGDETLASERDWTRRLSILDGQQSGSVIVVAAGAGQTTRVDGFTIRNGRAVAGAGLLCVNASPVIANNTFVANTATGGLPDGGGGGVHCRDSQALILNNRFLSNVATNGGPGGGIACLQASPAIVSNLFLDNLAGIGGGLRCDRGAPTVAHNRVLNNRAETGGGGLEWLNSAGTIRNNLVRGNVAVSNGGGITCWYSSPALHGNVILGNLTTAASDGRGGGLFCTDLSSPQVVNNTIAWNQAARGANVYCAANTPTLANNLIAFGSSGIQATAGLALTNNCVFGHADKNYVGLPDPTGTDGNISADPQLAATAAFPDVHLQPGSPCRDAGDAALVQPDWLDLDGQARIQGAAVDIGADESDGTPIETRVAVVRVSPDGDDANDGSGWGQAVRHVQAAIERLKETGGEVWVRGGRYEEQIVLAQLVHLFGGFAGEETERSQRHWQEHPTVLDGAQQGTVITAKLLLGWNTIDGFTIQNGQAARGGGIYCETSSPVIANNVIAGNRGGAGSTDEGGGGIYCRGGSALITNNVIVANRAQSGGGIHCASLATPVIANNLIVSNVAEAAFATGLYLKGGGGIVAQSAFPVVRNNFFAHNVVTNVGSFTGYGGGLCLVTVFGSATIIPQILNNTFLRNQATMGDVNGENGGALYCQSVHPIFANNLIAFGSSGILAASATITLRNNCVFGNAAFGFQGLADPTGSNGNIAADPGLLDLDVGFHLAADSPCRDAGDDASADPGWLDLDGQPRVLGAHVDIGADEIAPSPVTVMLSLVRLPNRQLAIHADGLSGSLHVLQSSVDFTVWTPAWTNQSLPFDYVQPEAGGGGSRFFRVMTTPE